MIYFYCLSLLSHTGDSCYSSHPVPYAPIIHGQFLFFTPRVELFYQWSAPFLHFDYSTIVILFIFKANHSQEYYILKQVKVFCLIFHRNWFRYLFRGKNLKWTATVTGFAASYSSFSPLTQREAGSWGSARITKLAHISVPVSCQQNPLE